MAVTFKTASTASNDSCPICHEDLNHPQCGPVCQHTHIISTDTKITHSMHRMCQLQWGKSCYLQSRAWTCILCTLPSELEDLSKEDLENSWGGKAGTLSEPEVAKIEAWAEKNGIISVLRILRDPLIAAVKEDKIAQLQALLQDPSVSKVKLGQTARIAAQQGRLACLQTLLTKHKDTITKWHWEMAYVEAAEAGHLLCLQELLRVIPEKILPYQGLALQRAAANGHSACIAALLAHPRDCYLTTELGEAIIKAAEGGHHNCISTLLRTQASISQEIRRDACIQAAKRGYHLCLKELFANNRSISKEDLKFSVIEAAKAGHLLCLQELLANTHLGSEEARQNGVIEAAQAGNLECLKWLLANATILQTARNEAIEEASKKGHLLCVEELLVNGSSIETADEYDIPVKQYRAIYQNYLTELREKKANLTLQELIEISNALKTAINAYYKKQSPSTPWYRKLFHA